MNAENQLSNYLLKFQELYASTAFLDSKFPDEMSGINEDFERAISQLKLLAVIHEKNVVGISGYQGVGKTTLLNWFLFDNPTENRWLPENQGVGENLPVLVTCERDRKKVEAFLFHVEKRDEKLKPDMSWNTINRKQLTTPEDTQRVVKNPENNHLMLELFVPMPNSLSAHTESSSLDETSFLLLPGFEAISDQMDYDKKYRQDYMRLALNACTSSIVVVKPTNNSQLEKENTLNEIKEIFEDTNSFFVLTHFDNNDGNETREYLQETLKIHKKNIMHSGTQSDMHTRSSVNEWRSEMLDKLSRFSKRSDKLREKQKKNIDTLISQCNKILFSINRLKDKLDIDEIEAEDKFSRYMAPFNKSLKKIRTRFIHEYESVISKELESTFTSIDEDIYNRHKYEKIGDWIYYKWNGPKPISALAKEFNSTFQKQVDMNGGDTVMLFNIYNKTHKELGVYEDFTISDDKDELKKDALSNTIPKPKYQLGVKTINNIQFLAGSNSIQAENQRNLDVDKHFSKAMEILPYLIFDTQRFQLVSDGKHLLGIFEDDKDNSASDSFSHHFGSAGIEVKSFLAGIAALAGTDLLPNGELDNIGSMFQALFGSEAAGGAAVDGATVAAAGGTSALGLLTGAAIGLIILQSINSASIQHGLNNASKFREIKDLQKDRMIASMMNNFDATFQRVQNLIEYRLTKYAFVNFNSGYSLKLENRIQMCESAGTDIKEALREEL